MQRAESNNTITSIVVTDKQVSVLLNYSEHLDDAHTSTRLYSCVCSFAPCVLCQRFSFCKSILTKLTWLQYFSPGRGVRHARIIIFYFFPQCYKSPVRSIRNPLVEEPRAQIAANA